MGSSLNYCLLVLCASLLVSCGGTGITTMPADSMASGIAGDPQKYRIGVGDVISISVWGSPELSLTVPVRPDGFVSMPLVGDVAAENMTAEELSADISVLLEGQLRNPQVAIIVTQVNSSIYMDRVRVTGAVGAQISLPYVRGMSVLDLILEAGGPTEVASANRAKLYRIVDGELFELEIRLNDILSRGRLDTNYPLLPGDVITVPERLF